ncbi:MAG: hypothetical protein U9Q92_05395 [archaeon]|nr:hypothetical protein [archaeon]
MAEDKKEIVEKDPSFILRDANLFHVCAHGSKTRWGDKTLGKCAVVQAWDQGGKFEDGGVDLNPTGVGGFTQGMFYGMIYEVGKDAWIRFKVDEWIESSHTNPEYHQMIIGQKAIYEDKIKQGLGGISQSVADLELLEHDIRKYEEYKQYQDDLESDDPKKKRAATFAVRTIFVDQVDFHAGGGGQGAGRLSLAFMRNNNIMPTIVNDFLIMESLNDIREGGKFANMADVEKKMLESKWTLYEHWLGIFRSAIMQRLDRIKTLQKSREFTIDQFRDWLKPVIARYKLIETGFAKADREGTVGRGRKSLKSDWYNPSAQLSYNGWTIWIYKPVTNPEIHTYPGELIAQAVAAGEFGKPYAYDKWAQDNLIFDTEHGLLADYPWLRKEWVDQKAKEISAGLDKRRQYYTFIRIETYKTVNKLVAGTLYEDTDFYFNGYVLSANAMLVKLLEKEAKEEELEKYLDDMLGLEPEINKKYKGIVVSYRRKGLGYEVVGGMLQEDKKNKYTTKKEMKKDYPEPDYYLTPLKTETGFLNSIKDLLGLDLWLFKKRGPYEHQFYDRYTKFYLKLNGERFNSVVNMIMTRMKIEDVS